MLPQSLKNCIDACDECATACDNCATACLAEKDLQMLARCICLDMDCADLCRLSAALMARGSQFAAAQCDLCAQLCDACAAECGKHDMDHCRECAQACRRCAEECRRLVSSMPHARRGQAPGAGAAH